MSLSLSVKFDKMTYVKNDWIYWIWGGIRNKCDILMVLIYKKKATISYY